MKVWAYAALNSKLRGMRAKRLRPEVLSALVPDPSALRSALPQAGYPEILADPSIPLEDWERGLWMGMARIWESLIRFARGNVKAFLQALLFRLDLHNVHTVLSALAAFGREPEISPLRFIDTGKYGLLRREALAEVRDFPSLGQLLRHTFLGKAYWEGLREFEVRGDLLALSTALDRAYFAYLWDLGGQLGVEDRTLCHKLLREYGAVQDIIAFLRLRFLRKLGNRESLSYLVAGGKVLPDRPFLDAPDSLDEAFGKLTVALLPGLSISLPEPFSLEEAERILWRTFYSECGRAFRGHPFHIGAPLAQFFLLEREVRALIAAAEGRALGLTEARIKPYL